MDRDLELLKKYIPASSQAEALKKYHEGYPLQYIIGDVEFYGYPIKVNEDVLIPRFETEQLVEKILNLLKKYQFTNPQILDLATGSGCIAIALKKEYSAAVTAIDYSSKALKVAKENAKHNNVQIEFRNLDILKDDFFGTYDLIISNPPYVAYDEKVDEKTKYEPQDAIFAAHNGLEFYEAIAQKSCQVTKEKSIIALEIGYNQKEEVIKIFQKYFPNAYIYGEKDYNDFDRFVFVINNCE